MPRKLGTVYDGKNRRGLGLEVLSYNQRYCTGINLFGDGIWSKLLLHVPFCRRERTFHKYTNDMRVHPPPVKYNLRSRKSSTGSRLPAKFTVKYVLEAVVLSIFLDLVPETLAQLTAHKRVLLLALLKAKAHLGQKLLQPVTPIRIPHVQLGGHEVGEVHALQ